jgi:dUTP pyrophosphatase
MKIINKSNNELAYQTINAACFDIAANESGVIHPGEWKAISTGLYLETGAEGSLNEYLNLRPRSSLALFHGVTILNSPATIDEDYKGEIKVILINHHKTESFKFNVGDRIAQGETKIVCQNTTIEVKNKERIGGFGSTGK